MASPSTSKVEDLGLHSYSSGSSTIPTLTPRQKPVAMAAATPGTPSCPLIRKHPSRASLFITPDERKIAQEWEMRLARREAEIRRRMEARGRGGNNGSVGLGQELGMTTNGGSAGASSPGPAAFSSVVEGGDRREYHYKRVTRYSTLGMSPQPDNDSSTSPRASTDPANPTRTTFSTPLAARARNRFATHDGTYLSPLSVSAVSPNTGSSDFSPTGYRASMSPLEGGPRYRASTMVRQASSSALLERYRTFGGAAPSESLSGAAEKVIPSSHETQAGKHPAVNSESPGTSGAARPRSSMKPRSQQRLSLIGMTTELGYAPMSPVLRIRNRTDSDEEILDDAVFEGGRNEEGEGSGSTHGGLRSPYGSVGRASKRPSRHSASSLSESLRRASDGHLATQYGLTSTGEGVSLDDGTDEQTSSLHRLSVYFADPYCPSPKSTSSASRPHSMAVSSSSSGLSLGETRRSSLAGLSSSPSRILNAQRSTGKLEEGTTGEIAITGLISPVIPRITQPSASPEVSRAASRLLDSPYKSPRPISTASLGRPLSMSIPPTPPPKVGLPRLPSLYQTPSVKSGYRPSSLAQEAKSNPVGLASSQSPTRAGRLREEEGSGTQNGNEPASPTHSGQSSPKWAKREQTVQEVRESGGWVLGMGVSPCESQGIFKYTRDVTPSTPPLLALPPLADYFSPGHRHTESNTLDDIRISVSPSLQPGDKPAGSSVQSTMVVGKMKLEFPLPPVRNISSPLGVDLTSSKGAGADGLHQWTSRLAALATLQKSAKGSSSSSDVVDLTSRPSTPTAATRLGTLAEMPKPGPSELNDSPGDIPFKIATGLRSGRGISIDSIASSAQVSEVLDDFFRRSSSTSSISTAPSSIMHFTPESSKRSSISSLPRSPTTLIFPTPRGTNMLRLETLEELMEGLQDNVPPALDEEVAPITPRLPSISRSATATPKLNPPRNPDSDSSWGDVEVMRFRSTTAPPTSLSRASSRSTNTKTSPAITRAPSLEFKFGGAAGEKEIKAGVRKSALPLPIKRQMSSPGMLVSRTTAITNK